MDLRKLAMDVINYGKKDIHPNSRFLIEKKFEERFGDTADVGMKLWDEGHIDLHQQYFLHAKVTGHDTVMFNLAEYDYPNPGFKMLTDVGIQDYAELVHVLKNYMR